LPLVGQLLPTSSLSSGTVGTTLLLTTGWPEAIGLITYVAVLRGTLITSRGNDEEPPTPDLVWRVVDADDPIVSGLAHIYSAALQSSGSAFEKDERESLARQWAATCLAGR
jgi:hypothetical protein